MVETARLMTFSPSTSDHNVAPIGVSAMLNRRFLICASDMSIGTCPSSIISKSVQMGGAVGNQILHFSEHVVVWLFAKLNVPLVGRIS